MAYEALYRKWRPKVFDDVVGQRHVTETIKNEIKNGTCSHAFLFCGSRGTGKTSTARILSRAINCEHPIDGNPCNECETCKGILNGSIMDIVEIDAASNSGVDNIRSLREEASYTAAITEYKVYIIDEVHALSRDAFNALLKLLEEPPNHVKFVLATTEANQVLDTISSRCQRFDFKRITPEDIYERLDYICSAEGIIAEEKALRMIASYADGSLRDALSCLDPCVAAGKEVDTEFVAEFLGQAENSSVLDLCRAIGENNVKGVLECIEHVSSRGKNLPPFIETVIKAVRDMLVISVAGKCKGDFEGEEYELIKEYSGLYSTEKLLYTVKVLSEAVSSARFMTNPRVIFETALIKLCLKGGDGSVDSILARVAELEKKIEGGFVPEAKVSGHILKSGEKPRKKKEKTHLQASEISDVLKKVKEKWPEIMKDMSESVMLTAALENASLRDENENIAITFPKEGGVQFREMIVNDLDKIKSSIAAHTGIDVTLVVRTEDDFTEFDEAKKNDPLEDIIKLPITQLD